MTAPSSLADAAPGEILKIAIEIYATGENHWAYRQVQREYDRKGRLKEEVVTQVDPSLPWDERDVLTATADGPATDREQRKYQKKREKERRSIERGGQRERRLRDLIDFDGVTVESKSDGLSTMVLPIRPDTETDFPMDKIAMRAQIDDATLDLRVIEAELLESVRHKAVANIKGMNLEIQFAAVAETDRPPALVRLEGTGRATVLFFPIGGSIEIERSDHRWVTPYDDRFNVEVGTPTAIDF